MEVLPQRSRNDYFLKQISRSESKFQYCKVSFSHVYKYRRILLRLGVPEPKKILCLGTRNGREVDIFRQVFLGRGIGRLPQLFEVKKFGWRPLVPWFERLGRNKLDVTSDRTAIGVEINPHGQRSDVLVASFDELPPQWTSMFDLVYSNSLDQSMNPNRSAREWLRVLKPGGTIIVGFDGRQPTDSDPTGSLVIGDISSLFPGNLRFYEENHSNYHDAIITIPTA